MADLNQTDAAQAIMIIGADACAVETNPVDSNVNGKLYIADISNNGGVEGPLTVGTCAVEIKVGACVLSNRVNLTAHNNSNSILYWGYTACVTVCSGTPLFKNQFGKWEVGPGTSVYLIAGSASNNVRVTESA